MTSNVIVELNKELLEVLVCPSCHANLKLINDRHVLVCAECAYEYAIEKGVPVLIQTDAAKHHSSNVASK